MPALRVAGVGFDHLLPFFSEARSSAVYVFPSGLGAPCAMHAIMIASATRSALALVLRCEDAAWKYALTDFQGSYGTPKSSTKQTSQRWVVVPGRPSLYLS